MEGRKEIREEGKKKEKIKELFLYFEISPHRFLRKLMTFVFKHLFCVGCLAGLS